MKILASQQNIILNKSVKLLKGHTVPKTSASYDYQKVIDGSGITRELYQFRDALGKIIKEIENVFSGNNLEEVRVTGYENRRNTNIKRLFVKDAKTGQITYTKEESFPMEKGIMSYIEKVEQGKADEHKIKYLSEKGVEKEISYKTEWDGEKPKVIYKNIKGKLPQKGLEYLPIVVSEGSTKRINHIAQAQINSHPHIKNLATLPYLKSCEWLNNGKSKEEIRLYWLFQALGKSSFDKVYLYNRIKSNEKLLEIIPHEYQHVSDKIGLNKVLSKYNLSFLKEKLFAAVGLESLKHASFAYKRRIVQRYKAMKDGIILPFSSKYKEYKTLNKDLCEYVRAIKYIKNNKREYETYRQDPLEVRAFGKGVEEYSKFYDLLLSIKDLMTK